MDDDSELLRRYASTRDEAAFAELVSRRLTLVYHAALRRVNGDATLAEEVAQCVFVSLARNAGTLRHHVLLSGWLYVATRHAAANALRQARRRQLREQNAAAVIDVVQLTGRTHGEVNAELNRKVGVKRISIATLRQLERRLEAARAMRKGR